MLQVQGWKYRSFLCVRPHLKKVPTQIIICRQLQFPGQRLIVCFRLLRTWAILMVAWHVMTPSSLVLATVLIGGSLEDPGKTHLCDLMWVMQLIWDSAPSFRNQPFQHPPPKATVQLGWSSPFPSTWGRVCYTDGFNKCEFPSPQFAFLLFSNFWIS